MDAVDDGVLFFEFGLEFADCGLESLSDGAVRSEEDDDGGFVVFEGVGGVIYGFESGEGGSHDEGGDEGCDHENWFLAYFNVLNRELV